MLLIAACGGDGGSTQMASPGFEPMNLSGTVNEDEIDGTLNGSGFVNIAVTLARQ